MQVIGRGAGGDYILKTSADDLANLLGFASKKQHQQVSPEPEVGQQIDIHEIYTRAQVAVAAYSHLKESADNLQATATVLLDLMEATEAEPPEVPTA